MTGFEMVAVALGGVAAGGINAAVGSGSLVSFPVLLAVGIPPVPATITNSLGLVAGGLAGSVGYRRELAGLGPLLRRLVPASVLGALTGAWLLLHLPARTFVTVVPVLVGLAVVLVAVQPAVTRALARRPGQRPAPPGAGQRLPVGRLAALLTGAYATGTYGGYFAASQGVLQMGIFGLVLTESLQRLNAIKNVLTLTVNAVAAAAYVAVAPDRVQWGAAGLMTAGSLVGGWAGARFGRRLPTTALRTAVVLVGVVAVVILVRR